MQELLRVKYSSSFIRNYKKLNPNLKEEVEEKIELFKNKKNHQKLKVHKLKGKLSDFYSFSVNYSVRIIFYFEHDVVVVLIAVGEHDIYDSL